MLVYWHSRCILAKPRVFVSSTYYDLKHIRASLDLFIESLGYEAVLSEKGEVAYAHDLPLDESCYAEVRNADILVLVIGGRYGSASSGDVTATPKTFHERYESITKMEYQAAVDNGTATYILVESAVLAEYRTYQKNKDNTNVVYAHVDSVNVFRLIEDILSKKKGNPVQQFEKYGDIERWLREQWAGLFRDMLRKTSGSQQLTSLQAEVGTLHQISDTLKTYLESMMKRQGNGYDDIIDAEHKKIETAKTIESLMTFTLFSFLRDNVKADWTEGLLDAIRNSEDEATLSERVIRNAKDGVSRDRLVSTFHDYKNAVWVDLAKIRSFLGLSMPNFADWAKKPGGDESENEKPRSRRSKKPTEDHKVE
jgi:hypothetical protein